MKEIGKETYSGRNSYNKSGMEYKGCVDGAGRSCTGNCRRV